ncbi:MAG: hypothetical protein WD042_12005 [Phycisphaeraceae bacterium]
MIRHSIKSMLLLATLFALSGCGGGGDGDDQSNASFEQTMLTSGSGGSGGGGGDAPADDPAEDETPTAGGHETTSGPDTIVDPEEEAEVFTFEEVDDVEDPEDEDPTQIVDVVPPQDEEDPGIPGVATGPTPSGTVASNPEPVTSVLTLMGVSALGMHLTRRRRRD